MIWIIALAIIFGFLASFYGIVQSIQIKAKSYLVVFGVFFIFYTVLIGLFICTHIL